MSMSEIEAQVLDTIDRWVEKEVKPIARKFDHADEYPHDLVEQMKELGLFGATISPSTAASACRRRCTRHWSRGSPRPGWPRSASSTRT
jgi:alkylation response protein AidB-like acyl-CoA dehydrogenase